MPPFRHPHEKHTPPKSMEGFIGGASIAPGTPQNNRNPDITPSAARPEGFYPQNPVLDDSANGRFSATGKAPSTPPHLSPRIPQSDVVHLTLPEDTTHRTKRRLKRPKLKTIFKGAGLTALLAVGVLGFFFGRAWWEASKILTGRGDGAVLLSENVKPEMLKGEGDGRINILLLGRGGEGHDGADLTDSILIASIDPLNKTAAMVSIPRDLWVRVPNYWSMKINAVFATAKNAALDANPNDQAAAENAGVDLLTSIVERDIGIPIHYYGIVNFSGFIQAVDAIGGVTVNVPEDLYDPLLARENGGRSLIAKAGLQEMDGRKALLYAQSRYTSSDFARGERQRLVLLAARDKVTSAGIYANPVTVNKLLSTIGDNARTNLSLSEMMRLYELGKEIPPTSVASLGFTDEPNALVRTAQIGDQSVVVPIAGQSDFSKIQSFMRNALLDGFLRQEAARVIVLNGTATDGLAGRTKETLQSYGYNVVRIDSAPTTTVATTQIIDLSNGQKPFTVRYLEQRFNTRTMPAASAGIDPTKFTDGDILVVVGQNDAATTQTTQAN